MSIGVATTGAAEWSTNQVHSHELAGQATRVGPVKCHPRPATNVGFVKSVDGFLS